MLDNLLGELSGKATFGRVLPTEEQRVKVEVSIQGSGELRGEKVTVFGTYWQTVRPGGVLYGEGRRNDDRGRRHRRLERVWRWKPNRACAGVSLRGLRFLPDHV